MYLRASIPPLLLPLQENEDPHLYDVPAVEGAGPAELRMYLLHPAGDSKEHVREPGPTYQQSLFPSSTCDSDASVASRLPGIWQVKALGPPQAQEHSCSTFLQLCL
jgi:hypothetical protein